MFFINNTFIWSFEKKIKENEFLIILFNKVFIY